MNGARTRPAFAMPTKRQRAAKKRDWNRFGRAALSAGHCGLVGINKKRRLRACAHRHLHRYSIARKS